MPAVTTKFTSEDELDLAMFEKILGLKLKLEYTESFWVALWVKQALWPKRKKKP